VGVCVCIIIFKKERKSKEKKAKVTKSIMSSKVQKKKMFSALA
jgi:hypothetical protein